MWLELYGTLAKELGIHLIYPPVIANNPAKMSNKVKVLKEEINGDPYSAGLTSGLNRLVITPIADSSSFKTSTTGQQLKPRITAALSPTDNVTVNFVFSSQPTSNDQLQNERHWLSGEKEENSAETPPIKLTHRSINRKTIFTDVASATSDALIKLPNNFSLSQFHWIKTLGKKRKI
jgi:hypothetical protein